MGGSDLIAKLKLMIDGDSRGGVGALKALDQQADKTQKNTGGMMAGLNKAANVAAVGVGAMAVVIGKSLRTYQEQGKSIKTLTRLTDISTEGASRLVGQWKRFGVDGAAGAAAVKFFSRNLDAARQGNAEAIESFRRLGISVDDLKNLTADQLLARTRDAMAGLDDKTARTALTLKLFGRGGTAMMAWLAQAPEDIAALNQQLEKLGLVWNDKQLKTFDDVIKAQREMQLAWLSIQITIARDVVPALTPLIDALGAVLRFLRPLAPVIVPLTVALGGFVVVVKSLKAVIGAAEWVEELGEKLGDLDGKAAGAKVAIDGTTRSTVDNTAATSTNVGAVGKLKDALGSAVLGQIALSIAIAYTTTQVIDAVAAWWDYMKSVKQADEAYQNATSTLDKAVKSGKTEEWGTPGLPGSESAAQIRKEKNRDQYKRPWWDYLNPVSDIAGLWNAEGGHVTVNRPTIFGAGEKGPEEVEITPLKKGTAPTRGAVVVQLSLAGANFYGAPTRQAAESWAQAMRDPLGRIVRDAMLGGATG